MTPDEDPFIAAPADDSADETTRLKCSERKDEPCRRRFT